NHIAGACPPKYNRFSTRIECRSGFFSDRRADARGLVSVWGAGAQSQPIVRLSAHVSYSYSYFTLEDHVFGIACTYSIVGEPLRAQPRLLRRRFQALKNHFMENSAPVKSA